MKLVRFFVTVVLFLGIASLFSSQMKSDPSASQVSEGNRQIKTAASLRYELAWKFNLLVDKPKYDWNKLSKADRQFAKEKLAEFISAVTRTFEIDAKKGIYLTGKEELQKQLDGAMDLRKSLDNFERTYGENFEPQKPKDHV